MALNFSPVTADDYIIIYENCKPNNKLTISDEFLPTGTGKQILTTQPAFVFNTMTETTRTMGEAKKFVIRKVSIHPPVTEGILSKLKIGMDVSIHSRANGVEEGYLHGIQPQAKNNSIYLHISLTMG